MGFELTPPEENGSARFNQFRAMIVAFYQAKWNQACPWDGSEGKQLKSLLASCPKLDLMNFKQWLINYGNSQDVKPGERPRSFLPRIFNYSVEPLDRYGRAQNVNENAASAKRWLADKKRDHSGFYPDNGAAVDVAKSPKRIGLRALGIGSGPVYDSGD